MLVSDYATRVILRYADDFTQVLYLEIQLLLEALTWCLGALFGCLCPVLLLWSPVGTTEQADVQVLMPRI
jgi:hypothetical protein